MRAILIAAAWSTTHLLIFLTQRGSGLLARERAIFLFHIGSIIGLAALMAALLFEGRTSLLPAIGALSLHGIYSLTFLELWSLAEGGYTVGMLRMLRGGGAEEADLVRQLATVGDQKRRGRIELLRHRGLIEDKSGMLALTRSGRAVAAAIRLLRWLANTSAPG